MAGIVIVFDFDKTIIDCDSDNWVVDNLGATKLFDELLPTLPWNTLMDTMMKELYSQGRKIKDIAETLKSAPLHPSTISAIKSANALGCCDLSIVSDANLFFIETILKHHDLMGCFSEIHTNPSFVDEVGRLRILPYHDFNTSSHGCGEFCPPNMCKGVVIERIKASALADGKKHFIYLGDGKGDFCPSIKLRADDYLICSHLSLVKAGIHEWSSWDDQKRILHHLINTIISLTTSEFLLH
ncbi:hypothetical protein AQUCO_00700666v1 [Aquilegia coerulea]|uniref:Uncharacterized protein n=1 Tax=Aquilegia coerulea TaxID=218851 RepID=A0A2G5EL45_AQUCA|nr:hypothetical protein AQUCO_00700666v1 [Aquilegia coerulea]